MDYLAASDESRTSGAKYFLSAANVVVKRVAGALEFIQKDWTTYVTLTRHNIPGILTYFPFRSNADVTDADAIAMEYIAANLRTFRWGDVDIRVFRSCVIQALLTALDAFEKCGFIHGDLHLDNVLLTKTTSEAVQYDCYDRPVPYYGYRIKLMDFELSRTGVRDARELFKDVKVFVNKALNLADYFQLQPLEQMHARLRTWIEAGESNPRKLLELVDLAQTIVPTGYTGPPMSAGKKRRANIYKRAVPRATP